MSASGKIAWRTPREEDLELRAIGNRAGVRIAVLPNGTVFAIEHRDESGAILVNQVLASPQDGGIGRIVLRVGGANPMVIDAIGASGNLRLGAGADCVVWEGTTGGVRHRVVLELHAERAAWLWRVEATNERNAPARLDAVLIQDLGLGTRAFVTNNEAYASQYIDHHIARHVRYGPVVMSRQNLAQNGRHPWIAHGCLDGARAFATDAMQVFGAAHRAADGLRLPFGTKLANRRLQHESSCAAIQSTPMRLAARGRAVWRFFACYEADHRAASADADLAGLDDIAWPDDDDNVVAMTATRRSIVQSAPGAPIIALRGEALALRYPDRLLEEWDGDQLLSFFVRDGAHNRHVVLADKEAIITRRHGAIVRSGPSMLPDPSTLCATCWMHGVFAAQVTIGNTSFHKLFSVSRDPYNIVRTSGLRMLIDRGAGWRLLAVPSSFEIGLSDCRWIYALADCVVTVRAVASGADPAMQWRVSIDGAACRLLVFGHLVLGERELEQRGRVEVDAKRHSYAFRPDPDSPWGQRYPDAICQLVTSTPACIDAQGGDELLCDEGFSRIGTHIAVRTAPTLEFCFAVVGSLGNPGEAERLASRYEGGKSDGDLLEPARAFWTNVTRGVRVSGERSGIAALNASLPWLAHDAMIHLTVPHGLEQYSGAAWGTRDVCQGPVEFLLALEHDEPVEAILRVVFEHQYAEQGDWPQWFMLEPYSAIQDRHAHGDVIVWPLKALNDYLEATNDVGFLDEYVSWCDDGTLECTAAQDTIAAHVDKQLATIRQRFIPGTHLIRYGEGDWNDSLQPADPVLRDRMVSSWTVALLYQQIVRYAEVLGRLARTDESRELIDLASAMRVDFNRFLVRDGTVAGYAIFDDATPEPELVIHPSDTRIGLRYSLLPMTRSIIAGLFTPEQAQHHLRIIRKYLLHPDGVRLIDRPVPYHGGVERTFRRAESASFFGREIGLMYVHAHLRYAEAMAALGEADALWEALLVADPIAVTERVAHASRRQRNAYFSSSDAAFADRYEALAQWRRVRKGTIAVDGGWRIYSSGPGLYVNVLMRHVLGRRRHFGERKQDGGLAS